MDNGFSILMFIFGAAVMLYAAFSEFMAHDTGKRTDMCIIDICYFQSPCVDFITCAHCADYRYLQTF